MLFVLGPRSSKVIRAGRLSDLIYNGGKEGRPARYCRVSLVFDNSDRTIPLDCDEVRLTRYVGLSQSVEGGYNSYFYINGRKATLADFDALLAHAKISAEGYNIVQQGDVSRVVEMTPVERRRVLEDIAGISRFDEDIRKAEEKRAEVEGNLERIEIILAEIRRQLRQLQRDREAALRYRELQETLQRARAHQAFRELHVLRQQLNSVELQINRYREEREKLRAERDRLQDDLGAAEQRLNELEAEVLRRGGQEFRELKERLDGLRVERARCQDGMERAREEEKELRAEALRQEKEIKAVRKEIARLSGELQDIKDAASRLEASIGRKEEEIEKLEAEAYESDARLVELQKGLVALDREIEEAMAQHRSLSLEADRARQTLELLEENLRQLEEEVKSQEFEVQDCRWRMKEASSELKEVLKEVRELEGRHSTLVEEEAELSRQAKELEQAIRSLSREYTHLKAEADAADSVRKGYNRAVTAILEARDTGKLKGIHGTIAELAQVKEEHETALRVAAGARMQAIVVDDDGTAAQAIELLKSRKLGRAIFLPLNKMLAGRPRGKALLAVREALGFAIDLVSFKEEYRGAFWYVFGDTVVVKDLGQARKLMGGVRLVTLDGQLVEASGAMIGGAVDDAFLKFGQGSRGRLEKVGSELRRASEQLESVEARLTEIRESRVSLEKALREAKAKREEQQARVESLRKRIAEAESRLRTAREALKEREARQQATSEKVESMEREIETALRRLEDLRGRREAQRKEISRATPQRIAKRLQELRTERLSLVEELGQLKSRIETLESQISVHRHREKELEDRLEEVEKKRSQRERLATDLAERLAQVEEELLGLQKMEERYLSEVKAVRDERDRAFKTRTELGAALEKLASKIETTEDFLLGLQAQASSLQDKVRDAEARLEELGPVEGEVPPLEEIKATIARCEKGLERIGAVNLRALEDYEEQSRRHDELREELSRLKKERQNLLKLVEELEARKKEGLLRVYHSIRENFRQIFAELSEGGEAELTLESEEDPFEGGLIIRARPPNKRFLRLEALSGGEKSLVSMAFIFAIQEYDPSPFYLLDEVDQNLDAVNAERIARMIRRNSSAAQFIQISLRKVTLKEADHIIGVTMGPRGQSEVVMRVNLEEIVEEPSPAEVAT